MIADLTSRLVDRIGLLVAARLSLRVLALELQVNELRRDLAVLRSDHDDLGSVTRELYVGPVAGDKA